jgi:hypothetical protein
MPADGSRIRAFVDIRGGDLTIQSELMLTPSKDPRFQWEESLNVVRWLKDKDGEEMGVALKLPRPTEIDRKYVEVVRQLLKISYEDNVTFFKALGLYPKEMSSWIKTGFVPQDRWRQFDLIKINDGKAIFAGVPRYQLEKHAHKIGEKETPVISCLREKRKLHSLRAVARELGISPHTVNAWIQKGIVPYKYFRNGDLVGKEAVCK